MSVEGEGCLSDEAECGGAAAGEAADEEGGFCGAVGGLADVTLLLLPSLVVLAPLEPPLAAPVAVEDEDSSVTEAWTTGISACRMAISHARATCEKT